jgi:hypothetical protein
MAIIIAYFWEISQVGRTGYARKEEKEDDA